MNVSFENVVEVRRLPYIYYLYLSVRPRKVLLRTERNGTLGHVTCLEMSYPECHLQVVE